MERRQIILVLRVDGGSGKDEQPEKMHRLLRTLAEDRHQQVQRRVSLVLIAKGQVGAVGEQALNQQYPLRPHSQV